MTVIGPQVPNDPRGWLVFESLPPELQRAEDATQYHDFQRHGRPQRIDGKWVWVRPATATERELLEHLGFELPDELETHVEWKTETLRRRTWPALESEEQ
ncbi:hypothetical protein BST27_08195 [Mycobacterium intermedium]|uniref:Uncharacterized protein n=1 Tax=Mycobacterium intermedium TaxID=28445 RepID=A0A1E3SDU3_MYCIE|nr:hypothetical protein [Mycobacterium intermedium]MCV6963939.1 hypothetical protein [Mycobacterium intermedium]ODR00242.1 hypothetical protein BHQ20_14085 [Mycobacterium intermedium]OPE51757.1 hypothetical protein BV508_04900 [Mycobacterium intermedium]ORB07824.1 hypothetical protein BST27_08195 [Mycobacterium intermedium]